MTDACGIYAIENLLDRRAYVGATKQGFSRHWGVHRADLLKGSSQVIGLQEDWDRHGSGWFKFVPLEVISAGHAFGAREPFWIHRLQEWGYHCYNVQAGAIFPPPRRLIDVYKNDALFTLQEVADLLKCRVPTVRAMIHNGELEAFRVRRNWRVSREALQRVVDKQASGDPPPPNESSLC